MPLGWLDHFEVLRLLGRGGMSDVYLAHDTHLDCDVALKVVREDHAGDAMHRGRLLDEARALAKLDHPNIVGILACGETAPRPPGFLWPDQSGPHPEQVVYLAMRYVEGTDLSEAIRSRRPSLERAVDWAKQIARGLEAAHARNVVHRDLKPANVRVTPEGVLKIVDFGLASSRRRVVDSLDPTQTPTREIILGTIGYSAPEQCEEAGHADPRCDLFSLGVILYELVTGHRPFGGDSAIAVLREIATREPEPLARYASGVPAELQRITAKLLEKDPKRRYQSAHEVLTDLEALRAPDRRPPAPPAPWRQRLGPVVLALALSAALVAGYFAARKLLVPPEPETLAIADFENLTGDPAMDGVARGLALDLVTSLVQTCRVTVFFSMLRDPDGKPVHDVERIAREYGASSVLLGTLHLEGEPGPDAQISWHLQIVRASDNSTSWARNWDGPASDLVDMIRSMTATVVAHWPRLPSAEAGALDAPLARSAAAQEAYLRGLALFFETAPRLRDSSIVEFDRALALEPEFGRALAYRARAKLARYLIDRDTTQLTLAERDARRAAHMPASEIEGRIALARILRERGHTAEGIEQLRAALRLNDRNPDAYIELGNSYAKLGEMPQAREYLRQSVELQPANPRAWRAYGRFLLQVAADLPGAEQAFRMELKLTPDRNRGYETVAAVLVEQCRYAEALAMYAKRPKPEEKSGDLAGNRGTAYFFNRNYDLALKDYLDAVSGAPEDGNWRINLGDVYAHLGRIGDAAREYRLAERFFERDLAVDPEDVVARTRFVKSLAKAGDVERARAEADRCIAAGPWRNAEAVHDLAMALSICGERDHALAALDTLVNGHGYSKCKVAVEDEFEGVRDDPRFRRLVGGAKR